MCVQHVFTLSVFVCLCENVLFLADGIGPDQGSGRCESPFVALGGW